jgi:flavin-dependent dehydrogenase
MYDAIVIGARCAGSPTAMLLARKGYRVLLADRAAFPSDSLCAHVVRKPAGALLRQWNLLDRVAASNCPPIRRMVYDVGPFALEGNSPPAGAVDTEYSPRRSVLDKILLDAAVEAGAEFRQLSVAEILSGGGRVTGVRCRSAGGATFSRNARIVIGADGRHSMLAQAVQPERYHLRRTLTCAWYSYWSGLALEAGETYVRDGLTITAYPTNDGLACLAVSWPAARFREVRVGVEAAFLAGIDLAPPLATRLRSARRVERFYGASELPNFFRKPYGPGWALVGDAGCHKDPIAGQGIGDAFRDAQLLAEAVDEGLSRRRSMDQALADYEARRNQAAMPQYDFTCRLAAMKPPSPQTRRLLSVLRDNTAEAARFLGTLAGTVPVQEYFAARNIARILAAAPRTVQ